MKRHACAALWLVIALLALAPPAYADYPDGGSFYTDVPAARSHPLGAAGFFHIFANTAKPGTHVNGNIAARMLDTNTNFGTDYIADSSVHVNKDIHYLQNIASIANSSFESAEGDRTNKVVFGKSVRLGTAEGHVTANDTRLDHLLPSEAFRDQGDNVYIDFDAEFAALAARSAAWGAAAQTEGVDKNFTTDQNKRYIDVSGAVFGGTGPVVLTKKTAAGAPLPGATFQVYNQQTNAQVGGDRTTNAPDGNGSDPLLRFMI